MTVAEYIAELQKQPQDYPVYSWGSAGHQPQPIDNVEGPYVEWRIGRDGKIHGPKYVVLA